MNRGGFTLIEVLAATVLTTIIALSIGTWLFRLQQSATTLQNQGHDQRGIMRLGVLLRNDLVYAALDTPLDLHRLEMLVSNPAWTSQRTVRWTLTDGIVTRSHRNPGGGPWTNETIANGVTAMEVKRDPRGRLSVHLEIGAEAMDLPVSTKGADAP